MRDVTKSFLRRLCKTIMPDCKKNKRIPQTVSHSQKQAKVVDSKSTKIPKLAADGEGYYEKPPVWAFSKSDFDHSKWGLETNSNQILRITKKLKDFEGMTWRQILGDTSGRKSAPKNCEKNVTQIISEAQERFKQLNLYHEHDSIYSLTIDGATRLWGVRTGNIFYVVWIDTQHEIYPVSKSHT